MSSRKLSESDKQKILELYRLPGETTSTLASRYGVSNSTISRILKNTFSAEEYEALIQQKRGGRSSDESALLDEPVVLDGATPVEDEAVKAVPEVKAEPIEQLEMPIAATSKPIRRRARRRLAAEEPELPFEPEAPSEPTLALEATPEPQPLQLTDLTPVASLVEQVVAVGHGSNGDSAVSTAELQEILDEELLDQDELSDLDDDDDLDEELDEDDFEEEGLEQGALLVSSGVAGKALVHVLPLNEAPIPKTCYLVVDRAAELIARPLKEFGDLGQIPDEEIQAKTLPIFDNHRVAKRFSNPRTQRVIKLPDGRVLQKTSSHLQAKGITRLLIDGQVYSL